MSAALIRNPPDLVAWREKLFKITVEGLQLTREEFSQYWPYMTGVYCCDNKRVNKNGTIVSYWQCRFLKDRASSHRANDSQAPRRKRASREAHLCDFRIKIIETPATEDDNGCYKISINSRDFPEHTHDLHASDLLKPMNDALREIVKGEACKGYFPHQILDVLQGRSGGEGSQRLIDAGGSRLTRKDISNVGASYRRANADGHTQNGITLEQGTEKIKARWRSEFRDILEQLQAKYYEMERMVGGMTELEQEEIMPRWIRGLRKAIDPFIGANVQQFTAAGCSSEEGRVRKRPWDDDEEF